MPVHYPCGGGGAGTAGVDIPTYPGAAGTAGGDGATWSVNGVTYAGGGGGGSYSAAPLWARGVLVEVDMEGAVDNGGITNGTANTGSGGGGAGLGAAGGYAGFNGGAGGSEIVIISYPTALASNFTCGGTATTTGSNTLCTYTSNGSFTVALKYNDII